MGDLQQAIEAFNLEGWLSSQNLIYSDNGGDNINIDCPVCGGHRKLSIHRHKKLVHCFKCLEGDKNEGHWRGKANIVQFIGLIENTSRKTAIQKIFNYSGIPNTWKPQIQFKSRPDEVFPRDSFSFDVVPRDHASVKWLKSRGVEHLSYTSRLCISGQYSYRVLLPCNFLGKTEGFEAKSFANQTPKALYPEWFKTKDSIYTSCWEHDIPSAVITESIFDAETFGVNAIGLYGSSMTEGRISRLLELKSKGLRNLIWCLDLDAWDKQAKIIFSKLSGFFNNYTVELKGKDPNALGRQSCIELLSTLYPLNNEFQFLELSALWRRGIFKCG